MVCGIDGLEEGENTEMVLRSVAPGDALSFLFLAEISELLRMTHDLGIWREER